MLQPFFFDPRKMSKDDNMHDVLRCRLHSTILNRVGHSPMLRLMVRILHCLKTHKEGIVLLRSLQPRSPKRSGTHGTKSLPLWLLTLLLAPTLH